jgi:hypothetical protein
MRRFGMLVLLVALGCGDEKSGPTGPPGTSQDTVPASWAGTWEGTENLAICGQPIEGPEAFTLRFCAGASLVSSLFPSPSGITCTGGFTDSTCTFNCQGTEVDLGCQRRITLVGTLRRAGSTITGSAEFRSVDNDPAPTCTRPDECTRSIVAITRTSTACIVSDATGFGR